MAPADSSSPPTRDGSRMRGCFVTATDTGVGKTILTAALVAALRAGGENVHVRKPVVTGLDEPPRGTTSCSPRSAASRPKPSRPRATGRRFRRTSRPSWPAARSTSRH